MHGKKALCLADQVTVLSIAALKKVTKGTRIMLLDRNSGLSKAIAKDLSKRGFKRVCKAATASSSLVHAVCAGRRRNSCRRTKRARALWLPTGVRHQRGFQWLDILKAADQVLIFGAQLQCPHA